MAVTNARTQLPYSQDTFADQASGASSGNSGVVTGFETAAQIRARLMVSGIGGSLPYLGVVIEDTLDDPSGASVYWASLGVFPTIGPTLVSPTLAWVNITGPFSKNLRFRWVVGVGGTGSLPTFAFRVDAVTKSGPYS